MANDSWDSLNPDELARLRDKRLRRQVRFQLYAFSPHYRRVFDEQGLSAQGFSGVSDLAQLPTVDREELGDSADDFLLVPSEPSIQRWGSGRQVREVFLNRLLRGLDFADRELRNEFEPVHTLETTGTTGEPVPISLSRRDLAVLGTQGGRALQVAGISPSDVVLNLAEPISAGGFWPLWLGAVALGVRQVAPGVLEPQNSAALARKINATVIFAMAADVLDLLEAAGEEGIPTLERVILSPELPVEGMKSRIAEAAGPRTAVVSTYGFAEGRALWAECAEGAAYPDTGYHINPDLEILETVSAQTGVPVRSGELGEIVFTGLDQRGTALARYRPGDVAMGGLAHGRCPYCGRNVERILPPVRRASNLLYIQFPGEDPLVLDMQTLSSALAHPKVASWEVEVAKTDGEPASPDEVYVLFSPRGGADPGLVAIELDRVLRAEAGFSPTQFVLSDRGGGKVVDLRPS